MENSSSAFISYSEAAQLTGKTIRTIRRKVQSGELSGTQIRKNNGAVRVSVAELERVFGKLESPGADTGGDRSGHERTKRGDMSGDMSVSEDTIREFLEFTKEQLQREQKRNERLENSLNEMWEELKTTKNQLLRLLPEGKPAGGTEADMSGDNKRTRKWWLLWIA